MRRTSLRIHTTSFLGLLHCTQSLPSPSSILHGVFIWICSWIPSLPRCVQPVETEEHFLINSRHVESEVAQRRQGGIYLAGSEPSLISASFSASSASRRRPHPPTGRPSGMTPRENVLRIKITEQRFHLHMCINHSCIILLLVLERSFCNSGNVLGFKCICICSDFYCWANRWVIN